MLRIAGDGPPHEHEAGKISYFGCIFADEEGRGFTPCALRLTLPDGAAFELTAASTGGEVQEALGKPARRDEDAEETVLYYEIAKHELEVECGRVGLLKRINLFRG